eukprot:6174163-Prymnesium_polylepis.1
MAAGGDELLRVRVCMRGDVVALFVLLREWADGHQPGRAGGGCGGRDRGAGCGPCAASKAEA